MQVGFGVVGLVEVPLLWLLRGGGGLVTVFVGVAVS